MKESQSPRLPRSQTLSAISPAVPHNSEKFVIKPLRNSLKHIIIFHEILEVDLTLVEIDFTLIEIAASMSFISWLEIQP